jgi:hypothetical protein
MRWHATGDAALADALRGGAAGASALVREHIDWALSSGQPGE